MTLPLVVVAFAVICTGAETVEPDVGVLTLTVANDAATRVKTAAIVFRVVLKAQLLEGKYECGQEKHTGT